MVIHYIHLLLGKCFQILCYDLNLSPQNFIDGCHYMLVKSDLEFRLLLFAHFTYREMQRSFQPLSKTFNRIRNGHHNIDLV